MNIELEIFLIIIVVLLSKINSELHKIFIELGKVKEEVHLEKHRNKDLVDYQLKCIKELANKYYEKQNTQKTKKEN